MKTKSSRSQARQLGVNMISVTDHSNLDSVYHHAQDFGQYLNGLNTH